MISRNTPCVLAPGAWRPIVLRKNRAGLFPSPACRPTRAIGREEIKPRSPPRICTSFRAWSVRLSWRIPGLIPAISSLSHFGGVAGPVHNRFFETEKRTQYFAHFDIRHRAMRSRATTQNGVSSTRTSRLRVLERDCSVLFFWKNSRSGREDTRREVEGLIS